MSRDSELFNLGAFAQSSITSFDRMLEMIDYGLSLDIDLLCEMTHEQMLQSVLDDHGLYGDTVPTEGGII